MMASFTPLADAIAAMLNSPSFATAVGAPVGQVNRIYDSNRNLEDLETQQIDVLLGDKKCTPLDRTRQKNTIRIEIAIRQAIRALAGSDDETTQLDNLVALMEDIDDYFSTWANRRPPNAPWAAWQESELLYPFLVPQLRARIFASVLRLTYFVVTGPATVA
jgi:hypothetical protein